MRTHKKTMSYVGAVALVIGAASPTFAQQTGPSCMAEIAQARMRISGALAGGFPTPADPLGPNSGAGRSIALPQGEASGAGRDIMLPQGEASGAGRSLAGGFPTPADPLGPNSGAGRNVAQAPSPTIPENPIAGSDRTLAAGLPTPADPLGPNSGAGRSIALPQGEASGAGRSLARTTGPDPSGPSGRIQQAQALLGAAQSACDAGDNAGAVAKARQAVSILQ